jgi:hypothetical protein
MHAFAPLVKIGLGELPALQNRPQMTQIGLIDRISCFHAAPPGATWHVHLT